MEKATQQSIKEHNRNLTLKTIIDCETISRAGIARFTGLTPTTVSDIVSDLLSEGLVDEVGVGPSTGGKNPILLSLIPDARCSIGLDLANNQFSGAIVNMNGEIKEAISIPLNDHDGEEALILVSEILDQLTKYTSEPLIGIGVGAPGLINSNEGMVINAVNFNWKNVPLEKILQERYGLPVQIINDCHAAAISEKLYGEGNQNVDNMVVINVRHGIGAGIIINGEIYQGDGGSAGEIGHIVVIPEGGELCRCGNYGCLETVASAQAIIRKAKISYGASPNSPFGNNANMITLAMLETAFTNGDEIAGKLVLDSGYYLGIVISWLVGIFNIQKIILTGDMTNFGEPWLYRIKQTMKNMSLERPLSNTTVEIGQLGNNGVILGASAALFRNYSLLFNN